MTNYELLITYIHIVNYMTTTVTNQVISNY